MELTKATDEMLIRELIKRQIQVQANHENISISQEKFEEVIEDMYNDFDGDFEEILTTIKEATAIKLHAMNFLNKYMQR